MRERISLTHEDTGYPPDQDQYMYQFAMILANLAWLEKGEEPHRPRMLPYQDEHGNQVVFEYIDDYLIPALRMCAFYRFQTLFDLNLTEEALSIKSQVDEQKEEIL